MADIRINSLPSTATSFNTDDYIAIDGASAGTRRMLAANPPFSDVTLGSSGPSVKSSLSARAPRQGLVFDGTAGATATISALGTAPFTVSAVFSAKSLAANNAIIDFNTGVGSSILIYVTTTGRIVIYDRVANATLYQSNTGVIEVNKIYHIAYARGVGVFVNGVNISGSFADGSNYTDTVYRIGWAASNDSFCTGFLSVLIYNRALSASEVVALYEAGAPAGADYNNASNTSKLTGANSDFSSAGNWTVTGSTTISGGKLNLSNGDQAYCTPGNISVPVGGKFRVTLTVDSITAGSVQVYTGGIGGWVNIATTAGTFTQEFTFSAASGPTPNLNLKSTGGNAVVDTVLYYQIGLLLAPDAAQAGGGLVWYDTSGNAANISWTSGVSWNVPSSAKVATGWAFGGNVGINTTSPGTLLDAVGTSSTGLVRVTDYSNGDAGQFIARGSRGTPSAPTAQSASDSTGLLRMYGYDGSSFIENARIYAQTAGTIATNRVGGVLSFWTHPDSTSAIAEAMRITQGQNLLIGTTTDGGQKLQVNGTAAFSGTVTTTNSFTTSTRTPGNDTAIQTLRADAANTDWPFQLSSIYDGGYVDNFAIFGGILGTGTRSAPKFTSANATGAWILRSFEGGAYFYVSRVAGASTNASPTDILSFNSTGNATFAGSIAIGNTVNTVSPTSPNRTITMVIGGTTYYIHAKTTND